MMHRKTITDNARRLLVAIATTGLMTMNTAPAAAQDMSHGADNFYRSPTVTGQRVTFRNQYDMKVVGTLFTPSGFDKSKHYAAIIVGHPMGAVRQQSANLYAQKLAEQGFATLSLDLSFWGKAPARPKIWWRRKSTPRISTLPWTSWARAISSTVRRSVSSASAAAAVS
jgi:hypothetical protein